MEHPKKKKHYKSKPPAIIDLSVVDQVERDAKKDEERQRKKQLRRAEKLAKRFAELGLDENGNELDNFSLLKYPVREWKFTIPGTQEQIALNPIVSLIAVVCLWGVVVWSTVDPDGSLATLLAWRTYVATSFTWLFLGSKALFFFFLMMTMYRYGHLHLGLKNDKPEFSSLQTAAMIFAAGAGPVFFVFSVAEPMMHRQDHFYAKTGYRSQDEVDMFALNMTLFNWGLNTWLTFAVVAVATALATHRFGLPLTFRSCFYPIFGAYTWGWIGDGIDGMAIVLMVLGVCSMLCSSTLQIVSGLMYLGWVDENSTDEQITMVQKTTVWITTFVSIASVISGLQGGIRYMSILAVVLAIFIGLLVWSMEDTKFILNLQVQTIGYHIQNTLFQLNFWTDAFGQLEEGAGRATDGKAAEPWWISSWTVFYQAWTSALACVFGVFVACICKGRKLATLVTHCLLLPTGICVLWFCIWGGAGMRQARQASELEKLGETHFNNSAHFLVDGSSLCYDVPQEDVTIGNETIFTNKLLGVTPVCEFDGTQANLAALHVLSSFRFPNSFGGGKGIGPILIFLYLAGCVIYYITMSDSASFMVDNLASNGRKNNHWARRLFWASMVGTLATTLLSLGGAAALKAIEAGIIVCALPFAILLCFLIQTITLLCRQADAPAIDGVEIADYQFPEQPEFGMPVFGGIFNIMEYFASLGKVNAARVELGMDRPTRFQLIEFFKGLLIPFVSLRQVLDATYPSNPKTNTMATICYAVCYVSWVASFLVSGAYPGLSGFALTMFLMTGGMLGLIRLGFRSRNNLRSNPFADLMASTVLWPQVLVQMRQQCVVPVAKCKAESGSNEKNNDFDDSIEI